MAKKDTCRPFSLDTADGSRAKKNFEIHLVKCCDGCLLELSGVSPIF